MNPPATKPGGGRLASLDYSVLQQCMHCGMCLPSCPTYTATGRERHSPRGRIALMRAVADGELEVGPPFAGEMSYCLGCLACTSACPAGVDYAQLLETARAEVEDRGLLDTPLRRVVRALTLRGLFLHPRLLRAAGRALRLWQRSGLQSASRRLGLTRLLPRPVREAEPMTPAIQPAFSDERIPALTPADGERRFRVLLLTGCVQDLVFSHVNQASAEVLAANGCEVVTPRTQHCCGSLHAHNGEIETARRLARIQLDAVDPQAFDAIVSNAGGCGSHLRHYHRLLADDPDYRDRARTWSQRLRDIHEWLVEIGFRAPRVTLPTNAEGTAVAYHDSCHLCHGQGVRRQPREVLAAIPGLRVVEAAGAERCCGSAGIYNLTQPETAARLQREKVTDLLATGATVIATANPGCHLQIANGLPNETTPRVVHPVVLLAEAYRREAPPDGQAPSTRPTRSPDQTDH